MRCALLVLHCSPLTYLLSETLETILIRRIKLYFYDTDDIVGDYYAGTGTLKLKGKASLYDYEESFRRIGYRGYDSFMRGLTSGGNQILRNVSITVFDGNGEESDKLYREFEVVGAKRMYTENAVGKLVCISEVCGRAGIYEMFSR